jgi:hypothetical protein
VSDSACAVVQGLDSITTTVGDTVSVGFGVYGTRNGGASVSGEPYTISLSDSTILQEISSSRYWHEVTYRALKAGSSVVTLTCAGGVDGSTKVIVH